jgi:hypothetical protein
MGGVRRFINRLGLALLVVGVFLCEMQHGNELIFLIECHVSAFLKSVGFRSGDSQRNRNGPDHSVRQTHGRNYGEIIGFTQETFDG